MCCVATKNERGNFQFRIKCIRKIIIMLKSVHNMVKSQDVGCGPGGGELRSFRACVLCIARSGIKYVYCQGSSLSVAINIYIFTSPTLGKKNTKKTNLSKFTPPKPQRYTTATGGIAHILLSELGVLRFMKITGESEIVLRLIRLLTVGFLPQNLSKNCSALKKIKYVCVYRLHTTHVFF